MSADPQIEELREQKSRLYTKWREASAELSESRDVENRYALKQRVKILHDMYLSICEELRRIDPDKPKVKQRPRSQNGRGQQAVDVLMESGALWADLQGHTWSQFEGYTFGNVSTEPGVAASISMRLTNMVRQGLTNCTDRQKLCMMEFYANGKKMLDIAAEQGTTKSTISRIISRGRDNVQRYIAAKLLIPRCIDSEGYFDYMKFVNSCQLLTDRQREILFMMLAHDTSYADIGRYIQRHRSVITRTSNRVESRLYNVGVDVDVNLSAIKIRRRDWRRFSEKQLAEQLGLSPRFYYSTVLRGTMIQGIPILHYAVLQDYHRCGDARQTAKRMGCSFRWVQQLAAKYQDANISYTEILNQYNPQRPEKVPIPQNPYGAFGSGGRIVDRVNLETQKLIQSGEYEF